MPADRSRWFTAEAGREPGEIRLLRRGDPETGNAKRDFFRDRGCSYGLTLDDAEHLRDALDEAIRTIQRRRP